MMNPLSPLVLTEEKYLTETTDRIKPPESLTVFGYIFFRLFLVKFAKLTVCSSSRCTGIRSNLIEFNVFD